MASPAVRPPPAVRAFAALLGVIAIVFNGLLMLSDRAPGALRRIGGGAMRRLFERIDIGHRGADAFSDSRLRDSDAIVHVVVWAVVVVLVGWAVWTWIGLGIGAVAVLACSLIVEFLQAVLTETRNIEATDIAANVTGVLLGALGVAACYAGYSAVAGRHRRRPRGADERSAPAHFDREPLL